jgi:enoyl-CoA hydratase/carnithine racemase
MTVQQDKDGPVLVVTIDRPEVRNAVDAPTAAGLAEAFRNFDADEELAVAVLAGTGGTFCAGADLKAIQAIGTDDVETARRATRVRPDGDGPLGPTRMLLTKPVIAAIEGHAVAGGLELALWCDLRVAAEDAIFGVFCRLRGVPLVDGGTIRLPRLIGHSRALDMILTGRGVEADEALAWGLANRVVPSGQARDAAVELAHELAAHPQTTLRNDRLSSYEQWSLSLPDAMAVEYDYGMASLGTGEAVAGATRFITQKR